MTFSEDSLLFKKVYGCMAAGYVYVSMGETPRRLGSYSKKGYDPFNGFLGVLEGAHYKVIDEVYGKVETLLPRTTSDKVFRWANGPKMHIPHNEYAAGMTEDGAERRFLTIKALIDKGGRITADDLQQAWLKYVKPENFGYLLTPRDSITYDLMKKLPAREVGRYDRHPGVVDIGQAVPPIGIINAGDPRQAVIETMDVSLCFQNPTVSYAPAAGAALTAAVAEGMKADATVDSMIDAALKYCPEKEVCEVIEECIELGNKYPDIYEVREPLYQKYGGKNATDSLEVIPEAFTMFYIAKGDPHMAGVGGTNLGRDADCVANIAALLGGALKGIDALRMDLVETVEKAIKEDQHTIMDMSIKEQSKALCVVLLKNIEERKNQVQAIESMLK